MNLTTESQSLVSSEAATTKILPKQIFPFFRETIITKNVKVLSKALCHEINDLLANPENRKTRYLDQYFWKYQLSDKKKSIISVAYSCWLKLNKKGNKIKSLIHPREAYLTEGVNKIIDKAQKYIFIFDPKKGWVIGQKPKILLKPKGGTTSELDSGKKLLLLCLQIQKEIMDAVPEAKIADLPKFVFNTQPSCLEPLLLCQTWYNCNLKQARFTNQIPLDLTCDPAKRPFSLGESLKALSDGVFSLAKLHEKGYVHADVKLENFLIKLNENDKIEGFLTDFDFAGKIGFRDFCCEYFAWDLGARNGSFTPYTDVYGLAIALGVILLPKFGQISEDPEKLNSPIQFNAYLHDALELLAKSFMMNSQQRDSFLEFFRELLKDHPVDFEEKLTKVETYLGGDNLCSQEDERSLKNFMVMLKVVQRGVALIQEVLSKNQQIYDFQYENLEMRHNLFAEQYPEAAKKLAKAFPTCTAEYFYQQLLEISGN